MRKGHFIRLFVALLCGLGLAGCGSGRGSVGDAPVARTVFFDFASDTQGWTGGFADLPADYEPSLYELDFSYTRLPDNVDDVKRGLRLTGHNRSDDLFMFVKYPLTGLQAKTRYAVTFSVQLVSNAPQGSVGIGGSPGDSVFVKAGAVAIEPLIVSRNGFLQMNIDKGHQSNSGRDMTVLGTIAVPGDAPVYQYKTVTNRANPLQATTDAQGRLWLIIGTDSGYEGLTRLYYSQITVKAVPQ